MLRYFAYQCVYGTRNSHCFETCANNSDAEQISGNNKHFTLFFIPTKKKIRYALSN